MEDGRLQRVIEKKKKIKVKEATPNSTNPNPMQKDPRAILKKCARYIWECFFLHLQVFLGHLQNLKNFQVCP